MIRISAHGMEFYNTYEKFFRNICEDFAATQKPQELQIFMNVLKDLNNFLYNQHKEI